VFCVSLPLPSIPLLPHSSATYGDDHARRSANAAETGALSGSGKKKDGEEEVKSSGTVAERVLFHVIMMLVSALHTWGFCAIFHLLSSWRLIAWLAAHLTRYC